MNRKGDFTADLRLLWISGLAVGIGSLCAIVAWVLQRLIFFFTNLFYYQEISFQHHLELYKRAEALGVLAIIIPVLGGLIVGLMARYGSERIRGHGIPEALEAILIGRSRMSPKVAVLKPLSSAISIGSGGAVRRGRPDHHDRRGVRLDHRAGVSADGRRAKNAAGRRRRRRHDGDLRHSGHRRFAGGRTAVVRVEATQPLPRGAGLRHGDGSPPGSRTGFGALVQDPPA
jgi:hypothetical protein